MVISHPTDQSSGLTMKPRRTLMAYSTSGEPQQTASLLMAWETHLTVLLGIISILKTNSNGQRKFFHLCTERRSFHYTLSEFVSRLVRERNHAAVESRTVDDSCCFIFCNSVLNCWILQTKFPHAWRNGTWATGYKQATFLWNLASTIFQNVGLNGKIFRETLKLIRKFIWTKFIRLQVGWEKSW